MDLTLIGRLPEQQLLQEVLASNKAELVSVIGRRRVGKTFLIESFFDEKIKFQITGIEQTNLKAQLRNFTAQLTKYIKRNTPLPVAVKQPKDWFEAFLLLIDFLESLPTEEKQVVFLDELPWLATSKSGFLPAFSYFWNSWAVRRNIIVVICGSAAAWMIKKVIHHKGSLYNRVTNRLFVEPFTLAETEQYLKYRNIQFNRYQTLQLYMVTGGIPLYLEAIRSGFSAVQNINQLAFSKKGLLRTEFSQLYGSLFTDPLRHETIIRVLCNKRVGMTRQQLIEAGKFSDGGTIQKVLDELLHSGFISAYRPFGKKKKEKLYRLTDEYSLFYLQFIEGQEHEGKDVWHHLSQTQAYKTWSGYAFENICMKHIPQIKNALGISGIYSLSSSFYKKGTATTDGTQIDLVIDRNDETINLFEIKFYNKPFAITKSYAEDLQKKEVVFQATTDTRKQIFWIFISAFGLSENQYASGFITKSLSLDDLFAE